MMDLRYHLASLMSVFLALAVGIVVGVSLGSSERQAATIQSLQRDVAAIRAEDRRLQEVKAELQHRLLAYEEAEQELLPLAVRGRLAGNRVALLLTGDAATALEVPVVETLRLAGAEVEITVLLPRDDPPPAGTDRATAGSESAMAVTTTLFRALISGQPALLESIRGRSPDLQVKGELRGPVRRLLLLCPNDKPEYARRAAAGDGVEATIGRLAREADALLVAGEPEESHGGVINAIVGGTGPVPDPDPSRGHESPSLLPTLADLGASTVDHVNTAAGQMAMVLALAGMRGRFGTGPGATRALPPLRSPIQ
jgi:hypothetical protein